MNPFPDDPRKIREILKSYERGLQREWKTFGAIDDSAGKRYWLGTLYPLLRDAPGALQSFTWFDKTFPHDMGEPFQYLCWSLA